MQILFTILTVAVLMTGTLVSLDNRNEEQEQTLASWSFFLDRVENKITNREQVESAPEVAKVPLIADVEQSFVMEWDAPETRLNRLSISTAEIGGYELYLASTSHPLNETIAINNPTQTSYAFENMEAGTYLIAIAAVDSEGNTSPASKTVRVVVN
jgi:hypothetical protein